MDAAGPRGGQTFSYFVPPELAEIGAGEAVLVEYGRRRALGVVFGPGIDDPERELKPVLALVRSDGPLLAPLQVAIAAHIAGHYLAPPALVMRQMLAPGMLERVERITRDVEGRAETEWRVHRPTAREKVERRVALTDLGRRVVSGAIDSARLGPRQREMLDALDAAEAPVSAARLAAEHGTSALPGLARRGLVSVETVRVERRPLAGRPAVGRGTRPADSELGAEQRVAVERIGQLVRERSATTLLLEGTTASGKTAVYAAAIQAALSAGRGALVLVPEIALAMPLLERFQHDLGVDVALLHSALGEGERADEWRRIRADEVRVVVGTRIAALAPLADPGVIIVDEEHDPAYKSDRTPRYQARDVAMEIGRLAGAPVVLGSATPDVASVGRAQSGQIERISLPRIAGLEPRVEIVDLRAELATGNRGLLSAALSTALGALDELGRRAGHPGHQSARQCLGRHLSRLRLCPDLPRVPAPSGLPCLDPVTALPSLRRERAGRPALPSVSSVRIRYLGGGTQRVEREVADSVPRAARPASRSRHRRAQGRGSSRGRCLRRRRGRRARRHRARVQGPRCARR